MLIIDWEEVCYEILVYKLKLSQLKTSTFPWVQSSEKWIFMVIKEHYIYLIFLLSLT